MSRHFSVVALLLLGWSLLPGNPIAWTIASLANLALPIVFATLALLAPSRRQQPVDGVHFLEQIADSARAEGRLAEASGQGQAELRVSQLAGARAWLAALPGLPEQL